MKNLMALIMIALWSESSCVPDFMSNKQASNSTQINKEICRSDRVNYSGHLTFIKRCKNTQKSSWRITECSGLKCQEMISSGYQVGQTNSNRNSKDNVTRFLDESINLLSSVEKLQQQLERY